MSSPARLRVHVEARRREHLVLDAVHAHDEARRAVGRSARSGRGGKDEGPSGGPESRPTVIPDPVPVALEVHERVARLGRDVERNRSPKCGVVVEAAVTGDPDPAGDVMTRYGPVIDDDPEGFPANAAPANTSAATATSANAILRNTGVLLSVRLRTGANETC
jgi:hypothetical protein